MFKETNEMAMNVSLSPDILHPTESVDEAGHQDEEVLQHELDPGHHARVLALGGEVVTEQDHQGAHQSAGVSTDNFYLFWFILKFTQILQGIRGKTKF